MDTNTERAKAPQVQMVAIAAVRPSTENARKFFDETLLGELAQSIKQVGIINPLTVRRVNGNGTYEIVAGERRYRAAKLAELAAVPVIVLGDSGRIDQVRAIENLQREDLQPLEEAEEYRRLSNDGKIAPEEIARKVGKSVSYVTKRLALLGLCQAGKKALANGKLSLGAALLIARLPSRQDQEALVKEAAENETLTTPELADHILTNFTRILGKAPFDVADATLVPRCGSCSTCPKRSGHEALLFDDMKVKDSCLDGACFRLKVAAAFKRMVDEKGLKTLTAEETKQVLGPSDRLAYNSSWIDVDERNYDFDVSRTPRAAGVLKVLTPTYALAGERIVTLVRKDELRALRSKMRAKETRDPSETKNEQDIRETMRREREQQELRRRIADAQFTAAARAGFPDTREAWHRLVSILVEHSWADTVKPLARRRGIQFKGFDYTKPLAEHMKQLDLAGLKAILFELLFSRANEPEEACGLVGINPKEVARKATAEFQAEKKAKRDAQRTKQPKSAKSARKAERKRAAKTKAA